MDGGCDDPDQCNLEAEEFDKQLAESEAEMQKLADDYWRENGNY